MINSISRICDVLIDADHAEDAREHLLKAEIQSNLHERLKASRNML